MKRSVSLFIAIIMVLSLTLALPQAALAADTVDRAAVVQRLYALEGQPMVIQSVVFADAAGTAYSNAAAWAYGAGIVQGYGDGCFHGDRTVTRAQVVTMLCRYAQYKGIDVSAGEDTNILSYADAFDLPEWSIPAFQWACCAGIASDENGYVMTAGGPILPLNHGFDYVRDLATMFYGIPEAVLFSAEMLDVAGEDVERRLREAETGIDGAFA